MRSPPGLPPTPIGGSVMTQFNDSGRWLRWLFLDHLLLIVVILMIAALLSTLYFRSVNQERLPDYELQRSLSADFHED